MQSDLIKEYVEDGKEVILKQGACMFCGQTATTNVIPTWNQKQIDETVTETCDCVGAFDYTRKKISTERAYQNIEKLFGKEMEGYEITGEELEKICKEAVIPIYDEKIKTITVDTGEGIKAKISRSKDSEFIKVERVDTKKRKME